MEVIDREDATREVLREDLAGRVLAAGHAWRSSIARTQPARSSRRTAITSIGSYAGRVMAALSRRRFWWARKSANELRRPCASSWAYTRRRSFGRPSSAAARAGEAGFPSPAAP